MTTHLRGSARREYVTLPWGRVHYRHAGDQDAPVILMLHQSPLSSATYEPALAPLAARGVRAVAVDTPGFGMSDAAPGPWSIPEYARAVWQIADAIGLDSVHLLGQHTGAIVAAEAALQQRQRVRGLVFQGIPLYSDEERAEKSASYAPGYTPAHDGGHLRVIWDRVRWLYPTIGAESASRQVAEYLSVGPDYAVAYRAVFDHRLDTAALAGIPTLLLHGGDDVLNRMNKEVQAAFPNAPLTVISGGTDFVAEEQPEEFASALAAHVRACAAGPQAPADEARAPGAQDRGPAPVPLSKPLYTATVEAEGGRAGRVRSLTGALDLPLSRPADRGEGDPGSDPEELFAAGFAACFRSALEVAARRRRTALAATTVSASVTLGITGPAGTSGPDSYGLAVALHVSDPGVPTDELAELVADADRICPYANAIRGNIPVSTQVTGKG
ncbi:Ohr family peroxiredoxin [Streptomyces sp. NPDC059943]|uniref:Ohr family peroxiredoxin n=1 Tax=Streptomyces sp. NPDC059943 TaxID=3347010 RepID=UPI003666A3D6